jgi:hypothetical protein|tara:strand:+ start:422 stop:667 length:246 start_codon:yes stop_codon:yes gene_type:complete
MIINALRKKYEYEIASAKANIGAYQKNPTGIGEHPDLVSAVDSEMRKLAAAIGNLEAINICYPNTEEGKQLLAETQIEMRL